MNCLHYYPCIPLVRILLLSLEVLLVHPLDNLLPWIEVHFFKKKLVDLNIIYNQILLYLTICNPDLRLSRSSVTLFKRSGIANWGERVVTNSPIRPAICEQLNFDKDLPMAIFPQMFISPSNGSVAFTSSAPVFQLVWNLLSISLILSCFIWTRKIENYFQNLLTSLYHTFMLQICTSR